MMSEWMLQPMPHNDPSCDDTLGLWRLSPATPSLTRSLNCSDQCRQNPQTNSNPIPQATELLSYVIICYHCIYSIHCYSTFFSISLLLLFKKGLIFQARDTSRWPAEMGWAFWHLERHEPQIWIDGFYQHTHTYIYMYINIHIPPIKMDH